METENIVKNVPEIRIDEEMKGAYLDYAMSVIIGRALPDFRDGLKPVHRRILYAMHELNNYHDKPYKKSARIVGDVIGKYHPHGDVAVYDSIVRMAQDFSLRYPIVDGQGNFGSVDGDSPAAMRYTEIRLAKLAKDFLDDLDKETVEFAPNYDGTLHEPTLMPTKIPSYLVNGSSGIAVGMATNVPPHNLTEVMNGLIALIDNPDLTLDDIKEYIKGPDFPTSGIICGRHGIDEAYSTGKGIIKIRARAEIEVDNKNNEKIVITEIPYQVNKAKLIEKIAELVKEGKIEGVSDLRDESSRDGIRVVVDVKKSNQANVLLNQLYKNTAMETSFGIIMLGLDNNQPRVFPLKGFLETFISFRKQMVTNRCRYELRKAEERAHLLLGLKIAVENIDKVVELIKTSPSPKEAKTGLCAKFNLSEVQAQAILDLRLQRLTALERDKIVEEYNQVMKRIAELKEILGSDAKILAIVKTEFIEIKERYGDRRKTEIAGAIGDIDDEDLIKQEDVVVTITTSGYIKRISLEAFRAQRRGGKGVKGQDLKEDDIVSDVFITNTHNYILCFSDRGKVYWLKVYMIPASSRGASKGKPIVNLINIQPEEKIVSILPIKTFEEKMNVVMVTKNGQIKKTELENFSRPKLSGIIALKTADKDVLQAVQLVKEGDNILISSRMGKSICFKESDVRVMGRTAMGVRGINLGDNDYVVGVDVIGVLEHEDAAILTVFENGYGKRTEISEFRIQSRAGKGVASGKTGERSGMITAVMKVHDTDQLMLVSNNGQTIRINIGEIRVMGRMTQGVKLMNLGDGEKLVAVAKVAKEDDASVA